MVACKYPDLRIVSLLANCFGISLAGSDTTAAAITSILYHLMRTPKAYEKLNAEIEEAAASGFLSPIIQYNEAVGLPYLSACCKEGMRLHPSVGLTLPRHVPKGGCMISGHWFPKGTRVGVNAAVVQRDKSIFGYDADEFVPERWFRKDAARMERYMFQVNSHTTRLLICHAYTSTVQFGAGSRTCIGKNVRLFCYENSTCCRLTQRQISLCEMYKVIPQLVRTFHLELVDPEKEWKTSNYWFNKPSKVYTRLRRKQC
jgi:cytochrome P450